MCLVIEQRHQSDLQSHAAQQPENFNKNLDVFVRPVLTSENVVLNVEKSKCACNRLGVF